MTGPNKTPFCVLEDELLWASDQLLRETGQTRHIVRSHNELNVAKVASCVNEFFQFRSRLAVVISEVDGFNFDCVYFRQLLAEVW